MSKFKKGFWLTTALTAAVAGFSPAMAQQATPTPTPAAAPTNPAEAAEEEDQIIVTGSRIRRDEFSSSSPITVLTAEQSELEGVIDTGEALLQSPLASGSFQLNNQLTGFVTAGGGGTNSISLRGLGEQRTLVLLNGRRAGPAGTRGQVGAFDLNVIPLSLVDRTEVLKDGASSIYGSDAIAGVINIITKQNLDGGQLNFFGNQSEEGGGEQYRIDGVYGKTFDRGYFTIAAEYFRREPLLRGDREDTSCTADYLFDAATGARVDHRDVDTGGYKCYNLTSGYLQLVSTGANLVRTRPGITYPNAANGNNSAFPGFARFSRAGFPATYPYAPTENALFDNSTVISPVDRYTVNLTGGFDLTSNVEVFGELLFNRRESEQTGAAQIFQNFGRLNTLFGAPNSLPSTNPNNTFGASVVTVSAYESSGSQSIDYVRAVAGIRGDVSVGGNNFDWEIYGQYSRSDGTYDFGPRIYLDRFLAVNSAGTACTNTPLGGNISNFNCSALPGGVPWTSQRILDGQFNAAEREFLFFTEEGSTTYDHGYIEGSISGDLFELPAGSLGGAFGFQVRHEEIDDTPGPQARASNIALFTTAGRTAGQDDVREIFAELDVPILKGVPLFENLGLNVSGRYSDYDSYGESDTYKAALNWQVTPAIRARVSRGTSFRAPGLYELYLGNQTGFGSQTAVDPCADYTNSGVSAEIQAGCLAAGIPNTYTAAGGSSATIVGRGGVGNLKPEESEATNFGLVLTPSFADLSISIDYYEIEIDNEVRQFGAFNILSQCYSGNTSFCSLFTRDPATNYVLLVNNSYVNVAKQDNRGIDLSIQYRHDLGFGELTFDADFSWQLEDTVNLLGGDFEDYNGSTYNFDGPDFTGNLNLRFERGDFTYFWSTDLIGKGSDTENFGGDVFRSTRYSNVPAGTGLPSGLPVYFKQYTEFTAYHTGSVRYVSDNWTFAGGVQNVFDERPPTQSSGQFRIGTAANGGYDLVGRTAFVRLGRKF